MQGTETAEAVATDYLVVGGGAVGMAFVDTLLTETDSTITIVDRRDAPGGHWNDAYPFIRLHAPSLFYGVPSRRLGRDETDVEGPNAGHRTLASKTEILDYYDQLLRQRFLPSRRVTWLPKHDYAPSADGRHRIRSLVDGAIREVTVARRLVDATRSNVEIPATHPHRYAVSPGVAVIAPHELAGLARPPARYCVVGAGKTAMDACTWLLTRGVAPSRIRWIKPRESWIFDREVTRDFEAFASTVAGQLRAVGESASFADFVARLPALGVMRIDSDVAATMFRGAMLSRSEVERLRTIEDVVRLGRVRAIEPSRIVLEQGVVASDPDTLYVDCTAAGHNERGPTPIFEDGRIDLQLVRSGEPLFSASLIAFIESRPGSDAEKNALGAPLPLPWTIGDMLRTMKTTLDNFAACAARPDILAWSAACPLSMLPALDGRRARDPDDPLMQAFAAAAGPAAARLPALIEQADAAEAGARRGRR